ncbi:MAG: hypothetical protein R2788_23305 [Saprospiraceae bacterium]
MKVLQELKISEIKISETTVSAVFATPVELSANPLTFLQTDLEQQQFEMMGASKIISSIFKIFHLINPEMPISPIH